MIKKNFDQLLTHDEIQSARTILTDAQAHTVNTIINVGTSLIESKNCITLAQHYEPIFAVIGIHPNDLTAQWRDDFSELQSLTKKASHTKIVGIGECGLDFHYPDYNLMRQKDAFKAQIELALESDLALVVHTRDAGDETLRSLEEFKGQITRGIIHCFSEDLNFARTVIEWGFAIGIGGALTYPKNEMLRTVVKNVPIESIVFETDAPYLPIQSMRGKVNAPRYIKDIAEYCAQLRNENFDYLAKISTQTAQRIFCLN